MLRFLRSVPARSPTGPSNTSPRHEAREVRCEALTNRHLTGGTHAHASLRYTLLFTRDEYIFCLPWLFCYNARIVSAPSDTTTIANIMAPTFTTARQQQKPLHDTTADLGTPTTAGRLCFGLEGVCVQRGR